MSYDLSFTMPKVDGYVHTIGLVRMLSVRTYAEIGPSSSVVLPAEVVPRRLAEIKEKNSIIGRLVHHLVEDCLRDLWSWRRENY